MLNAIYHFTDLESLVKILHSNQLNPTVNFVKAFERRGLAPSVSLTRDPRLKMYGPVRLTLDMDKIRQNYRTEPYEFDPPRHGRPGDLDNREELVVGKPLKNLSRYLIRIDILKSRTWKREGWDDKEGDLRSLTRVPVYLHDDIKGLEQIKRVARRWLLEVAS